MRNRPTRTRANYEARMLLQITFGFSLIPLFGLAVYLTIKFKEAIDSIPNEYVGIAICWVLPGMAIIIWGARRVYYHIIKR